MARLSWNNPGNILFGSFAQRFGAVNSGNSDAGGKTAQFPTPQAGVNALGTLLKGGGYYGGGNTTLNDIMGKFSPLNPTAAQSVSQYSGLPLGTDLHLDTNPANLAALEKGIARQEGYSTNDINSYFGIGGSGSGNDGMSRQGVFDAAKAPEYGLHFGSPDEVMAAQAKGNESLDNNSPLTDAGLSAPGQSATGAKLPGPLANLLGMNAGDKSIADVSKNASGNLVSGMWEALGTQAVTKGAATQAQAAIQAGKLVSEATTAAGKMQSQSIDKQTAGNAADTAATIASSTEETNSFLSSFRDLFVRGWLGFAGIVLLAAAVFFLARNAGPPALKEALA